MVRYSDMTEETETAHLVRFTFVCRHSRRRELSIRAHGEGSLLSH